MDKKIQDPRELTILSGFVSICYTVISPLLSGRSGKQTTLPTEVDELLLNSWFYLEHMTGVTRRAKWYRVNLR